MGGSHNGVLVDHSMLLGLLSNALHAIRHISSVGRSSNCVSKGCELAKYSALFIRFPSSLEGMDFTKRLGLMRLFPCSFSG